MFSLCAVFFICWAIHEEQAEGYLWEAALTPKQSQCGFASRTAKFSQGWESESFSDELLSFNNFFLPSSNFCGFYTGLRDSKISYCFRFLALRHEQMLWQMLVRTFHDYCFLCDQGKDFHSNSFQLQFFLFALWWGSFYRSCIFRTLKMFKQQAVSGSIWKWMCESPFPAFPCTFLAV